MLDIIHPSILILAEKGKGGGEREEERDIGDVWQTNFHHNQKRHYFLLVLSHLQTFFFFGCFFSHVLIMFSHHRFLPKAMWNLQQQPKFRAAILMGTLSSTVERTVASTCIRGAARISSSGGGGGGGGGGISNCISSSYCISKHNSAVTCCKWLLRRRNVAWSSTSTSRTSSTPFTSKVRPYPFNIIKKAILRSSRETAISKAPQRYGGATRYPAYIERSDTFQHARKSWYRRPFLAGAALVFGVYAIVNSEQVPISGRWRVKLIPTAIFAPFAALFDDMIARGIADHELDYSTPEYRLVSKIAQDICAASGIEPVRVHVVETEEVNAFCTAGGLVQVNTGLIKAMGSDRDRLAVVIGHEIAHYVAEHVVEQSGRFLILFLLKKLAGAEDWADTFTHVLLSLPLSRKCEMEADYIGVILAARACYNVKSAARETFALLALVAAAAAQETARKEDGAAPPPLPPPTREQIDEFIRSVESGKVTTDSSGNVAVSTHPSTSARIRQCASNGALLRAAIAQQSACKQNFDDLGAPEGTDNPVWWWVRRTRQAFEKV